MWRCMMFSLLVACDPDGGGGQTTDELSWYLTCGDPACSGYSGPFEGVSDCVDEAEGAACAEADASCDPHDACNATLVCAAEDPKDQTGGCPISRRKYKHDIRYLSADEVDGLRRDALDLPLATWRYNGADEAAPPRLGFIIDDRPALPAVAADGEHVDLYGLASMAIASVQAQQRELDALRARQAELEAELTRLRAERR